MDDLNLADPEPTYRPHLHGHPIHSRKRSVEVEGFTYVPNYTHYFIRAKDVPAWIVPINAADWGFVEWLPSQTDMVPGHPDNRPMGHPAVNHNGDLHLVHALVFPAFSYR